MVRAADEILLIHVSDNHNGSRESGKKVLQTLADKCSRRNLRASTVQIANKNTVSALRDVCKTNAVDLLVVGSRGHGPIRRALLGSVSSAIAQANDCPVMVVKKPKHSAGAFLKVVA